LRSEEAMKNKISYLLVVSMCLFLIVASFSGCVEDDKEEILIGVILPQTGALSSIGGDMVKAAQLAADHINEEGGILNGKKVKVVIEDSQTTPDQAKLAAQRLIAKGVKVIVGAAASSCTLAVATETEPSEVVIISPASTSPELSKNDWIFRVVGDDNLQGKAMIDLTEALNITNIVVFSINNAYGAGIHDVILDDANLSDMTIVQESLYEENKESYESDLTTIKTAIEASVNVTVGILFTGYGEQALKIFESAHKLEMTAPNGYQWISNEGIVDAAELLPPEYPTQAEAANGTYGTAPAVPLTTKEQEFKDAYKAKYGSDPISYGDYTYDSVRLGVAAIEKVGSLDGVKIRAEIFNYSATNPYEGVSGDKSFDANGDIQTQYYDIWKFTGSSYDRGHGFWQDPNKGVENFNP
jgi:branched-chain amino acid transport system substrate-binding protein